MKWNRIGIVGLVAAALLVMAGCGQPVAGTSALPTARQFAESVIRPRMLKGKEVAVYKEGKRNAACWAYELELSAFAPGAQDGCLISPSIYMVAGHDPGIGVGGSITFFSRDGEKFVRKVVKQAKAATYAVPKFGSALPDVTVFLLDAPLPSVIVPVKFLPTDWARYIDANGAGMVAMTITNLEEALVVNVQSVQRTDTAVSGNVQRTRYTKSTATPFAGFSKGISGAESGSPTFLATGDGAVLLSLAHVWVVNMDTRAGTAWTDAAAWGALENACAALGTKERPARADFSRFKRLN